MPRHKGGETSEGHLAVLLFYQYVELPDVEVARNAHEALCRRFDLSGRLRISREGLNGNLSGTAESCEAYCRYLRGEERLDIIEEHATNRLFGSLPSCDFKLASCSKEHCFRGLKCWVANEVTGLWGDQDMWSADLESERIALAKCAAGQHLAPAKFHERIASASVQEAASNMVLFDARNIYETRVGRFEAPGISFVDPCTRNFSDLRSYFEQDENLEQFRGKEVLMYCTGGVRCERSSALLVRKGVAKAVYQLEGGIQRYMDEYGVSPSSTPGFFRGKMHVFDRRGCVAADGTLGSTEVKNDTNNPDNTISRCILCQRLWDQYKGKRRCVSCGTLVLVCEQCQSAGKDRQQGSNLRCELCPLPESPSTVISCRNVALDARDEASTSKTKRSRRDSDDAIATET